MNAWDGYEESQVGVSGGCGGPDMCIEGFGGYGGPQVGVNGLVWV